VGTIKILPAARIEKKIFRKKKKTKNGFVNILERSAPWRSCRRQVSGRFCFKLLFFFLFFFPFFFQSAVTSIHNIGYGSFMTWCPFERILEQDSGFSAEINAPIDVVEVFDKKIRSSLVDVFLKGKSEVGRVVVGLAEEDPETILVYFRGTFGEKLFFFSVSIFLFFFFRKPYRLEVRDVSFTKPFPLDSYSLLVGVCSS
jgi:hypothetical protein